MQGNGVRPMLRIGSGAFVLGAVCLACLALLVGAGTTTDASNTPLLLAGAGSGGDPALDKDSRYTKVSAAPGNGSSDDAGAMLPPVAARGDEVLARAGAGPTAFYVGVVDANGSTRYWRGVSDDHGFVHFRAPAGAATLMLFRSFDSAGKPAGAARCAVSDVPPLLPGFQPVNAPGMGAAISGQNSTYEVGGQGGSLITLQTNAVDPLHANVLAGGRPAGIETQAASSQSVVARMPDDQKLGPTILTVQSAGFLSNSVTCTIIKVTAKPIVPMRPGGQQDVVITVQGLTPRQRATARFTVSGAARIASGEAFVVKDVVNNTASVRILALAAGQLIVAYAVDCQPPPANELPTYPPVGYPPPSFPPQNFPTTVAREPSAFPTTVAREPSPGTFPTTVAREPHPTTTTRPTIQPSLPPSWPPSEPPTISPSPPRKCQYGPVDGWMEPSQGVWQDDDVFEDRPGKQLTRELPLVPINYVAELNMVTGRDTLLFGVNHYRTGGERTHAFLQSTTGGRLHVVRDRDHIVLIVKSNCSIFTDVKFRFSLSEYGSSQVLYTSGIVASLPLSGQPVADTIYKVSLDAYDGIPPYPRKPFRLTTSVSDYTILAELVDPDGHPIGVDMRLRGVVQRTYGPNVNFTPVILSTKGLRDPGAAFTGLRDEAGAMARDVAAQVPDYFPLVPNGLPVFVRPVLNLTDADIPHGNRSSSGLVAALGDRLSLDAFLEGAGRVVAVLRKDEYYMVASSTAEAYTTGEKVKVGSFAVSGKLIVSHIRSDQTTIAHELVHTLPWAWEPREGKWIVPWMIEECDKEYHNQNWAIAFGERITRAGLTIYPEREQQRYPVMGPAVPASYQWITQCTYHHLVSELGEFRDPPVRLVRAILVKNGSTITATLRPEYTGMGDVTLRAGTGAWRFDVRDRDGKLLAGYPFTPVWRSEAGGDFTVISVFERIPDLAAAATLELVGPSGVLGRLQFSPQSPTLSNVTAQVTGSTVRVSWSAVGSPGYTLRYSVLYSYDAGAHYFVQRSEQTASSATIPLIGNKSDGRVKVIVTDGTRSSEAAASLL